MLATLAEEGPPTPQRSNDPSKEPGARVPGSGASKLRASTYGPPTPWRSGLYWSSRCPDWTTSTLPCPRRRRPLPCCSVRSTVCCYTPFRLLPVLVMSPV
jgi:hypothetical protein